MNVLLTVMLLASTGIGVAVLLGALAVLHALDLRRHRWLPAGVWLGLAAAGAWLAFVPVVQLAPPPWPVLMLGLAAAWVVWRDVDRWPGRAEARSSLHSQGEDRA